MSINLEQELNEGQRCAVEYCDGPALVIAGAGSGKTRVLTYKIAYLLEQGYNPYNILALTFTNKAAQEMKERIAQKVGNDTARYLWMGTFHAIFARILRTEADRIGFPHNFTIYDQADSENLIKTIIKEMGLDKSTAGNDDDNSILIQAVKDKGAYKPRMVQSFISKAKNQLVLPNEYAQDPQIYKRDLAAHVPAVRDIYVRYTERLRAAEAMDFDDLLVYTHLLFTKCPDICQKYADHFHYVLVDEYQDTNFAQHSIVWQLTQQRQRICVVGDDAQSIYSFRGAKIENILEFTKRYKDAKLFRLEQNYRSTQNIVLAANSLIEKNSRQIPKKIFSKKEQGDRVTMMEAETDRHEGELVLRKMALLSKKHHYNYNAFAILYRTNAQSRIFEEALRAKGIPYRIYGGLSFYQRKEIKDVIAYCRLVLNPNDEEAFKRIVNYPARGIGKTTIDKISATAHKHNISLWQVICNTEYYGVAVSAAAKKRLHLFADLIRKLSEQVYEKSAYEIGALIISEAGIMTDLLTDTSADNESRHKNVEELLNAMHNFVQQRAEIGNHHVQLADYLADVSLLSEQDRDTTGNEQRITLMTIHAAKGLEFPVVFVVGMEEMLFPNVMASNSLAELEEERRLFYVAITRAESYCFLSYAKERFRCGHMELCNPSSFFTDIDSRYIAKDGTPPPVKQHKSEPIKVITPRKLSPIHSVTVQQKPFAPHTASIAEGQMVEHATLGIGKVLSVIDTNENQKVIIRFQDGSTRTLLVKFARLKIIK